MSDQSEANVALIRRYYDYYAANDLERMRDEIFHPNVVWRIPGRHPLSGEKRGLDEILAFFELLARSSFKAELHFLEANDEFVVDYHRGWSSRGDGSDIDLDWVLVYRIAEGRIIEATDFSYDQVVADGFFWSAYPMTGLRERIAQESK